MGFFHHDSSLEEKKPFISAPESTSTLDDLEMTAESYQTKLTAHNELLRQFRSRPHWLLWLVQALLLSTSCTLFLLSLRIRPTTLSHVQQFSAYSPAASAVEYKSFKYNITTKNNRFVGAGPEVDKAWREISYDMGDQMILPSELPLLDMPESSLKVKHPKTGVEGYRVGMEVFHQLHCINLLRRVTYKEYYEPLGGEFGSGPEALQKHTDHCIEILRLNTQCNADVGLFTLYMVEGDPLAWPELNSWHTCRDFDKVRDWAVAHSVGNMEL